MVILGIETSCDETAAALLQVRKKGADFFIQPLADIVATQIKIHRQYGGVVPMLANREHVKNLPFVLKRALKDAFGSDRKASPKIDLIAVTFGPGLMPSLLIGVNFARTLGWAWKKKIIGVNHLEGHLLSFLLPPKKENLKLSKSEVEKIFPAVCLLVSGGHTQLIYAKGIGDYEIIGETRDDAAGECFDKGARILGLGYPGGPVIAAEAAKIKNQKSKIKNQPEIKLPRPMINANNYDFSFSGLKTALLYSTKKINSRAIQKKIPAFAFELQEAISDVLVEKTFKAATDFKTKFIILGGGVVANKRLREKFQARIKENKPLKLFIPLLEYTTDNAMMIALAGFFQYQRAKNKKVFNWKKIDPEANLRL